MTDDPVRRLAEHFANPNDDGGEGEVGDENHVTLARAYLAMTAERDRLLTPIPETEVHGYALTNMEKLLNAPEGSTAAKLAAIIAQWTLGVWERRDLRAELTAMTAERDKGLADLEICFPAIGKLLQERYQLQEKLTASEAEWERMHDEVRADCDSKLNKLSQALDASEAALEYAEKLLDDYYKVAEELTTAKAHSESLAKSLLHALAEHDDALWEIERINGRAQQGLGAVILEEYEWVAALRDILARGERALAGSKRIKEDE